MDFDRIVRGGTLVDGSGAAPLRGDVGIRDGRIEALGSFAGEAGETIDASGCFVAPGFVDPHTHLDAQLCWDGTASPSNLHGVTTVVMGLCGFGVAPCPPGGGDYLLRSLQEVEEIPLECTSLGVPFAWSSYGEYLAHLEGRDLSVNAAGFVPHSALRTFVMGERARGERATEEERAALVAELERSLSDGALGLASSRGPNHRDAYGDPVPSRFADDLELSSLVAACRGRPWQINLETKFQGDLANLLREVGIYEEWTRDAGARLTWTPFHAEPGEGVWREVLAHNHATNAGGVEVRPQVCPQPITVAFRFDRFSYVVVVPDWRELLKGFFELSPEERLARFADPGFREALRRPPADPDAIFAPDFERWMLLVSPSRPAAVGTSIAAAAREAGAPPADFLCDLVIADALATVIQVPAANRDSVGAERLVADPGTLLGLGDAGAHVTSINNYSYPSQVLSGLVRERGVLSVESAVQRLTSQPARFLGIEGRGELARGMAADLAVFDLERVSPGPVGMVHDLPGGAPRLFQGASGYRAVLVNGVPTIRDDTPTGATPGRVLRA